MPYQTEWVKPDLVVAYRGVRVYHTYRYDDYNDSPRLFWFTLDPQCGEEACACQGAACQNVFDVRSLPEYAEGPVEGADSVRRAVRAFIDRHQGDLGQLRAWIRASQP